MKDKKLRKKGSFYKTTAIFIALLMTSTFLAVVKANGPHETVPRSIVFNEMRLGENAWIELVNPTSNDIEISEWKLQIAEDTGWKTIYTINSVSIGKWGSGNEYIVFNLVLPNKGLSVRIVDNQGNEIDGTTYSSLDEEHSWARYKQSTGIPVDTNSTTDWYISSKITKGYENDSVIP